MSNHICSYCGRVLESGSERHFQDEVYCESCLQELTILCDHCGKRIFREEDEGNTHITLCSRCFSNYYTACERCGRLILNEDAYYEDEDDNSPYCYECFQQSK